jgi:hypothetical protein
MTLRDCGDKVGVPAVTVEGDDAEVEGILGRGVEHMREIAEAPTSETPGILWRGTLFDLVRDIGAGS